MKQIIVLFIFLFIIIGCSSNPEVISLNLPKTYLKKSSVDKLSHFKDENYKEALSAFINNCKSSKTKKLYAGLCKKALITLDAEEFFKKNFDIFKIYKKNGEEKGLLTGYYEANLKGSLTKKSPYLYPIYKQPSDLINVDLNSIYPELKKYRLRGRIKNGKLIPYFSREQMQDNHLDAEVICYVNSKIDLFFLEVQGSGRITLDNGSTIFVGYANQNGYKYRSIGKYLVKNNEIKLEDISLQTIKSWLEENPNRVDEVLNYNKSVIYFKVKKKSASGSLGLVLTPKRSVAVDRSFIPLGSVLYLSSKIDGKDIDRIVMAQDTGGAIKGPIRADMFFGFSDKAKKLAGELKSPLQLWIFLPKESCE